MKSKVSARSSRINHVRTVDVLMLDTYVGTCMNVRASPTSESPRQIFFHVSVVGDILVDDLVMICPQMRQVPPVAS